MIQKRPQNYGFSRFKKKQKTKNYCSFKKYYVRNSRQNCENYFYLSVLNEHFLRDRSNINNKKQLSWNMS